MNSIDSKTKKVYELYDFKEKLYYIIDQLDNINKTGDIMEHCVKQKLDDSLKLYYNNLISLCDNILSHNSLRLMKKLAIDKKEVD